MKKLALLALLFTGCFQHRFGYLVEDPEEAPKLSPMEIESRRSLMEVGQQIGVMAGIWQQEDGVAQPGSERRTHNPEVAGSNPAPAMEVHVKQFRRLDGTVFKVGQPVSIAKTMRGEWLWGYIKRIESRPRYEPLIHVALFTDAPAFPEVVAQVDPSWLRGFHEGRLSAIREINAHTSRILRRLKATQRKAA